MQPKLLPLGEKLPPGFLSSLVNRLSPSTYVNLRRTCSDLDEMIEDAVDRNEIHVNMKKGNSLKLEFFRAYYRATFKDSDQIIRDVISLFSFHYRSISIRHDRKPWALSSEVVRGIDSSIKQLLSTLRYDELVLVHYHDSSRLLDLLSVVSATSLWIANDSNTSEPIDLELLRKPQFQKFAHLSVIHCMMSISFNLLDLCKGRVTLELRFGNSEDDIEPMYTQFIQDVYNDVDVGPLEKITMQMKVPPSWSRGIPNGEIGNVAFTLLKGPTWLDIDDDYQSDNYVYFCQTGTRVLLLSVLLLSSSVSKFELYILPPGDLSAFVQALAYALYETRDFRRWRQFPLDNSCLYSLLEGTSLDLYSAAVGKYMLELLKHMNKLTRSIVYTINW